jgi:transcriptional regulator with XRE-family HTH domain
MAVSSMRLGKRLQELREAAGLSQARLAKLVGVTRNAVSQWEANTTQPSTKRLAALARALNVAIDQIMAPGAEQRTRVIEDATRLVNQLGADGVSVELICATAELSREQFAALFGSKDALLFEVAQAHLLRASTELHQRPPRYGTLLTRLKYLLLHFCVHDLAQVGLVRHLHASSWQWSAAREREYGRHLLELHSTIIAIFDEAAARGEINPGNYRAASSLLLAAYQLGLRQAIHNGSDPDQVILLMEPQLAIILGGFGFREVRGLSEEQ